MTEKIALDGATVAITGAARGIGLATARRFASLGARVAIGDLDLAQARAAAAEVGHGATGYALDVADKDSYVRFLTAARADHGDLDVLVNNAGIMPNGAFLELDDSTDRLQFDVNVFGVINGMKLALPGMLARGRGHVVNVASLAGKFPVRGLAVYNATKFAVVGLSAATRLELEGTGVTLTVVLPSAVDTPLASGLSMAPLPKVKPEAIARAVVDSVSRPRAEVAVPSYVGQVATLSQITPEPVLRRVRHLLRDDRALRGDAAARAAYQAELDGRIHP
ncbi:MAG: SDR family oxidoreductase [Propionibacteriales bacterium]|nr:SDR family oxidoreductase [Propionibacteriales bacterium]